MRYSKLLVRAVTGEAEAAHSPVGWSGTQRKNDTLLWGQSISFGPEADGGGVEVFTFGQQQIIKVFYERPTTWTLKIVVDVQRPPGETASFEVDYPVTIGVGTTNVRLNRFHVFPSPAPGGPEQFEDTLTIPAQGIQVDAQATIGATGVITAGSHQARVTALIAPVFT